MPTADQLPLPLPHRSAMGRADFMVADSNRLAVGWIDRWPDWPGPLLSLYGPEGSGKSHLITVWCTRSGALRLSGDEIDRHDPAELAARGRPVHVIGGARLAGELDAKRAIDEGARLGNRL